MSTILTYATDIADRLDLMELYRFYREHYPRDTRKAINICLQHLKINHHFYKLPTHRELEALLTLCENDASKYAAQRLGIHPRTAEEYKSRLRDKLMDTKLDTLLVQLRKETCTSIKNNNWPTYHDLLRQES